MFHYPYTRLGPGRPAAPFVLLNLACERTGRTVTDLPALADTGADQTVLPDPVVSALGLTPFGQATVSGYIGPDLIRPTYVIRLAVRDLPPVEVEVLADWSEGYAVLGRDVLNRYRVVFDGPNLRLEIR